MKTLKKVSKIKTERSKEDFAKNVVIPAMLTYGSDIAIGEDRKNSFTTKNLYKVMDMLDKDQVRYTIGRDRLVTEAEDNEEGRYLRIELLQRMSGKLFDFKIKTSRRDSSKYAKYSFGHFVIAYHSRLGISTNDAYEMFSSPFSLKEDIMKTVKLMEDLSEEGITFNVFTFKRHNGTGIYVSQDLPRTPIFFTDEMADMMFQKQFIQNWIDQYYEYDKNALINFKEELKRKNQKKEVNVEDKWWYREAKHFKEIQKEVKEKNKTDEGDDDESFNFFKELKANITGQGNSKKRKKNRKSK